MRTVADCNGLIPKIINIVVPHKVSAEHRDLETHFKYINKVDSDGQTHRLNWEINC